MSQLSFKNKVIFKSKLENIQFFVKLWRRKDFDLKNIFEEQVEMDLYKAVVDFEANNIRFTGVDSLYTVITLTLEKMYEGDRYKAVMAYLEDIKNLIITPEEMDYLKREMETYVREHATFVALVNASDKIDKIKGRSYSDSSKEFYSIYEEVEKATKFRLDSGDSLGLNLNSLKDENFDRILHVGRTIPFPRTFSTFNKATDNGITTQTLNVAMGSTHIGKTRFLLNLAVGYFLAGHSVVYHTLEIAETEVLMRMLSIILKIPRKNLKRCTKAELMKLYTDFKTERKMTNNLFVKGFPSGFYSVIDTKEYINDMNAAFEEKDRPYLYFIDGLNNISPDTAKSQQNSFFMLKDIVYKLQGIASSNDIAIWSACQMSKDTVHKVGNDHTSVQESFAIIQASDFAVVLENTKEMAKLGYQAGTIQKNRYAKPYVDPIYMKNIDADLFNVEELPFGKPEWNSCDNLYRAGLGGGKGIEKW